MQLEVANCLEGSGVKKDFFSPQCSKLVFLLNVALLEESSELQKVAFFDLNNSRWRHKMELCNCV